MLKDIVGDQAVRYTLLVSLLGLALAGVFLFLSSRTIEGDAEAANPTG